MIQSKFIDLGNSLTNGKQSQFSLDEYSKLIYEKGNKVLHEKTLICPCKSSSSNHQSNCKNCGGSGYLFVNARETRMVIQSVSVESEFKPWSQEAVGTINVTASYLEELCQFDKITLLDSESIFIESVEFFLKNGSLIANLGYKPIKVFYVGLFKNTNEPLIKLQEGVDFTIDKFQIVLNNSFNQNYNRNNPYRITVRYRFNPSYIIVNMVKDSRTSNVGQAPYDEVINLPFFAIARRSHYIEQLNGLSSQQNLLNNNDYSENNSC